MTEHKDRGKSFLTSAKGALVLIIASVGSVALFFAVAQVVDFITFKNSTALPRRLLPFETPPLPAAGNSKNNNHKGAQKVAPPLKLGFYTDLFRTKQNTSHPVLPPKKEETKSVPMKTPAESAPPAKNAQVPDNTVPEQPAAGAQYILQLGAFQKAEKAALVVTELQNAGYTAYTDTITVPGKGTLIRVRLGSFSDVSEARKKAAEIQGKTRIPVLISKK